MPTITRLVRITGRVQGVAFRAWTQAEATRRGLRGWVRNEPDGSVSTLVSGKREAVDEMLSAFWSGPGAADVRDVQAEDAGSAPDISGFDIHR